MKHTFSSRLVRFVLTAALLFVLVGLAPASASASALATGDQTQTASNANANVVYTVKKGDTLARIAQRYGVTVQAILRANPAIRNPDRIYIGQRIVIPTASSGSPTFSQVNIYLIGIGTGGVGCGDQVVAVKRNITPTQAPLTAALNQLLSLHDQYYGQSGLYNALYQSSLSVQNITRTGTSWRIYLRGTLRLGGVCDSPRVEAQLRQTALQFSTVKQVSYFINGVPLATALSQK
jgi:LysM repeat protein